MQEQIIIAHEFIRGKAESYLHGNDNDTENLPKMFHLNYFIDLLCNINLLLLLDWTKRKKYFEFNYVLKIVLEFIKDCKMINSMNNMVDDVLYKKISNLPPNIKHELLEYIEFLIHRHNPIESRKHPKAGCMKGMFAMSDDFNEPLECFNEYMK